LSLGLPQMFQGHPLYGETALQSNSGIKVYDHLRRE
jgi:hypothetical protein